MTRYYTDDQITLHLGDALDVARELPSGAADCIVTSPPYFGLRDAARLGNSSAHPEGAAAMSAHAGVPQIRRRPRHEADVLDMQEVK